VQDRRRDVNCCKIPSLIWKKHSLKYQLEDIVVDEKMIILDWIVGK